MYIRVPSGITRGSTATVPFRTAVPVAVLPPPALAAVYHVAHTRRVTPHWGSLAGAATAAATTAVPWAIIRLSGCTTVSERSTLPTSTPFSYVTEYSRWTYQFMPAWSSTYSPSRRDESAR